MRSVSHVLLTLEAIILVFLTAIAGLVLIGGSGLVWMSAWNDRQFFDALMWIVMLLSLVADWWLLLAYFYQGHRGARRVPAAIWVFAGIIALLTLWDAAVSGPSPAILFVPTLVHLSAEVWVWPPDNSLERIREE